MDSSLGAWGAPVTNYPQGSVSPCAPVLRACVTLCPSVPGTMSPCAPLSQGLVLSCAPTFIAPDSDLLVRSLLNTPRAPPLGPEAGGWPPAPCEAEGAAHPGNNPCTSLSDPGIQAGLLWCWGAYLAWSLSPGWTRASRGHVAGHVGPRQVALDQAPASPRGPWLRAGARRALALCTCVQCVLMDHAGFLQRPRSCLSPLSSADSGGAP